MYEERTEAGLKIRDAYKSEENARYALNQPSRCKAPPFPLLYLFYFILFYFILFYFILFYSIIVLSCWEDPWRISLGPVHISAECSQAWPLSASAVLLKSHLM